MSKAFVRESDFDPSAGPPPIAAVLPPGSPNLLTPTGAQRLRNELARLVDVERPPLAAAPDDRESRQALQVLDQRIRHLRDSLRTAEIVSPPASPDEGIVRFGANVRVREPDGSETNYRIVGVDEADADAGCVSWLSPVGRALLNARIGSRVAFRTPAGLRELEVLQIEYETGAAA